MPDPGRKPCMSRPCQTGYRPRSRSAYSANWVSNQNLSSNWRKILVYVPCDRIRKKRSWPGGRKQTIAMLSIASFFHAGSAGSNFTSSFWSTPVENVVTAKSALRRVPSTSVTTTPSAECAIERTVALRKVWDGERKVAASAWMKYLKPR
jgi:hypothetical protein